MLQNLSLDKTTRQALSRRTAAPSVAAPDVRPRWRRLPRPSRFFLSVQAYAAGHHDAALRAAPAPAVPRPIWARAPEEVVQLLAGAILRDAAGAAVFAASPVVVQAPDVHGAMAPHVSVHTSAAGTNARYGAALCCSVSAAGGSARLLVDGWWSADHRRIRVQRCSDSSRCLRPASSTTARQLWMNRPNGRLRGDLPCRMML